MGMSGNRQPHFISSIFMPFFETLIFCAEKTPLTPQGIRGSQSILVKYWLHMPLHSAVGKFQP